MSEEYKRCIQDIEQRLKDIEPMHREEFNYTEEASKDIVNRFAQYILGEDMDLFGINAKDGIEEKE